MKLYGRKRGQSVLEYTLILGVVITAIILTLFGSAGTTGMKAKIQDAYTEAGDAVTKAVADMTTGVFK
jgi:uncharacterized protein (UPF0333 family)